MNDEIRLEEIDKVLEDLSLMVSDHIILVEGINDERALKAVGIYGEFRHIQSEGGPIKAAEYVYRSGKKAVVLTDWDRKGDILCAEVCNQLEALDVRFDTDIRRRLAALCSYYIKDVESIDALVSRLGN